MLNTFLFSLHWFIGLCPLLLKILTLGYNPQQYPLLCPIQTQTFCLPDDVSSSSFSLPQGIAPEISHINQILQYIANQINKVMYGPFRLDFVAVILFNYHIQYYLYCLDFFLLIFFLWKSVKWVVNLCIEK